MSPLVSVVIPAMNRFGQVRNALESVRLQRHPVEVILVDDSNQPGMDAVVADFVDLKIIHMKNAIRQGSAGARNQGLKSVSGAFVAFLDSDDVWKPGFLAAALEALDKSASIGATVCLTAPFFDPGFRLPLKIKIWALNWLKNFFLLISSFVNHGCLLSSAPYLTQCSHMVFRNKDLPIFDTAMPAAEDWKFVFQFMQKAEIAIIPRALVGFRYSLVSNSFNLSPNPLDFKRRGYEMLTEMIAAHSPRSFFLKLFRLYTRKFIINNN